MKSILILGAGKSTMKLIEYLNEQAGLKGWQVTLADKDGARLNLTANQYPHISPQTIDIRQASIRDELIKQHDLIISILPPDYHPEIARSCLRFSKHLITPSYLTSEIRALGGAFREKGLICLNEVGLDPGIDHASACQVIDKLSNKGAKIHSFESYTGGLIHPEYADNPWQYKFTWNPHGIVSAGRNNTRYLKNGRTKIIPYHRLFKRAFTMDIPGTGQYEAYPNRDSLKYRELYRLNQAETIIRGTLRPEGFCKAWYHLVQLGLTLDEPKINTEGGLTWNDLTEMLLPGTETPVKNKLAEYLDININSHTFSLIDWLGIFEYKPLPLTNASPAEQLTKLLIQKWELKPTERDMVIMLHRISYTLNGQHNVLKSTMKRTGQNKEESAMSETVGLPVGICARLIMEGGITTKGVILPVTEEIYEPLLRELQSAGIYFEEINEKG